MYIHIYTPPYHIMYGDGGCAWYHSRRYHMYIYIINIYALMAWHSIAWYIVNKNNSGKINRNEQRREKKQVFKKNTNSMPNMSNIISMATCAITPHSIPKSYILGDLKRRWHMHQLPKYNRNTKYSQQKRRPEAQIQKKKCEELLLQKMSRIVVIYYSLLWYRQ